VVESAAPLVALDVIVLDFRATGVSDRSYLVVTGDDALVVEGGYRAAIAASDRSYLVVTGDDALVVEGGYRAAIAASILDAAGYRVTTLDGGGVPDLLSRP